MTDRRGRPERRNGTERRKHNRKRTCISASLVCPESTHSAACIIRDADVNGCMIYSSSLEEFPDTIMLHAKGLNGLINGNIAWRTHNMAGIKFNFEETD